LQTNSFNQSPKRSRFLIYFIISILIIVGAFGAWQFFGVNSEKSKTPEATPTPKEFQLPTETPAPEATPTGKLTGAPSPTATLTPKPTIDSVDKSTGLDRSELTVEVQNGSGVAGAAGEASDQLKALGYDVVLVGNADNFDYEKTVIQVKSTKSQFLSLLKKDLGTNYNIGTASADLTATSSADALVIVGK